MFTELTGEKDPSTNNLARILAYNNLVRASFIFFEGIDYDGRKYTLKDVREAERIAARNGLTLNDTNFAKEHALDIYKSIHDI